MAFARPHNVVATAPETARSFDPKALIQETVRLYEVGSSHWITYLATQFPISANGFREAAHAVFGFRPAIHPEDLIQVLVDVAGRCIAMSDASDFPGQCLTYLRALTNSRVRFQFCVDGKKFETDQAVVSVLQVITWAAVPPAYQLFIEEPDGKPDRVVLGDETVDLRLGIPQFYTVPLAIL